VKPVKAEFMQYENSDKYTACQSDSQSGQINEGISFMSQYIPEKDNEEVSYHVVAN